MNHIVDVLKMSIQRLWPVPKNPHLRVQIHQNIDDDQEAPLKK
jgi:hypothetical protein